jgi:hypothetical protein
LSEIQNDRQERNESQREINDKLDDLKDKQTSDKEELITAINDTKILFLNGRNEIDNKINSVEKTNETKIKEVADKIEKGRIEWYGLSIKTFGILSSFVMALTALGVQVYKWMNGDK